VGKIDQTSPGTVKGEKGRDPRDEKPYLKKFTAEGRKGGAGTAYKRKQNSSKKKQQLIYYMIWVCPGGRET